jgi:hypothetical protein
MSDSEEMKWLAECTEKTPHSALEKRLIKEYLSRHGHTLATLKELPQEERRALMVEACKYASTRMAQVESKVSFRDKIRSET